MLRDFPISKPVVGQPMRDAVGNHYEVLQVGLKYVKVKPIGAAGPVGLVKITDLFSETQVMPPAPAPQKGEFE